MNKIEKIRKEIERRRVFFEYKGETPDEKAWRCLGELISFLDTLSEEPASEDLEKEFEKEFDSLPQDILDKQSDGGIELYSQLYAFARHFANWQKEQDDKETADLLTIAHLQGAEQMKEQMLMEAVEGEVVKDINNKLAVTAKINLDGFKFGERVKVIIIKEDADKDFHNH